MFWKRVRLSCLVIAMAFLVGAFFARHGEESFRFYPVEANCLNPQAWGYASIGDELGRVHSWARVRVNGLEPRQEYEVIGFKNGTARMIVLGRLRTDFSGSGGLDLRHLPLGTVDVVNIRLPGVHGSAQLTSAVERSGASRA